MPKSTPVTPVTPIPPKTSPFTPTTTKTSTHPISSPLINEHTSKQSRLQSPSPSPSKTDADYAEIQFNSPSIKKSLKQCSHLPFKTQFLLDIIEKEDPRLFKVVLNHHFK